LPSDALVWTTQVTGNPLASNVPSMSANRISGTSGVTSVSTTNVGFLRGAAKTGKPLLPAIPAPAPSNLRKSLRSILP